MPEVNYKSLLLQYTAGNLVPIIGSDLYKIKRPGQEVIGFEDYLIETLAGAQHPGDSRKIFSELAFEYPELDNLLPGIYRSMDTDLGVKDYIDTDMIQKLAILKNFKVLLTTSYDRKLEEYLGADTEVLSWSHAPNEQPLYLNFKNPAKKLVYLFGRIKKEEDLNRGMSFNEADRMECLYNLSATNTKSSSHEQYSLLEYLKGKTLLFIGNNFQDSFMRFAIRTLCNAPYNSIPRRVYIINDSNRRLNFQEYFFKRFEIQLIHEYPIEEFVNNLYNTIAASEKVENRFQGQQVFLSYDRDDFNDVSKLYNAVNGRGVNIWMDKKDLGVGPHEEEIRNFIEASSTSVFLCVLSKGLVEKKEDISYAKRLEWKMAAGRYTANQYLKRKGDKFDKFGILPVAIDDYNQYYDLLPSFIKENTIYSASDPLLLDHIEKFLN